jgi:RNA polymerase sigma-70 factor, ECF subfamily
MNRQDDEVLFSRIQKGDKKAFEALFRAYYPFLCQYATRMIKDLPEAEEIVQGLFTGLWEKRTRIDIKTSVKNYLFRSVKNRCLNTLNRNHLKNEFLRKSMTESEPVSEENYESEFGLLLKIEESISSLPEKRQEIFRLNREEGLKYREIADRLNISLKTVESQMGLALKALREKLKDFLVIL